VWVDVILQMMNKDHEFCNRVCYAYCGNRDNAYDA